MNNVSLIYQNLKTGKIYTVLFLNAVNATNGREGELMVIYTDGKTVYPREKEEFMKKFRPWHPEIEEYYPLKDIKNE